MPQMPGALGTRTAKVSRLMLHWAANDGTLEARSGQVAGVTYPGTGSVYGYVVGANGTALDAGRTPRFLRPDSNNDGTLDLENALLVERNITTVNDNGTASVDLTGWTAQAGGAQTRVVNQTSLGGPLYTAIYITGAAAGDGTRSTLRAGGRFPVDPSVTLSGSWWINPDATLVGRTLRARFSFFNGAAANVGDVDVLMPITRTGWQLRGGTILFSAIPGTAVTFYVTFALHDAGAAGFYLTGVTLANDRMTGSPIPTGSAVGQRRGMIPSFGIPEGVRALTMWLRFAPVYPAWTPTNSENAHPVYLAAIGQDNTLGGYLTLSAGASWRLLRATAASSKESTVAQPGGAVYPLEVLGQYYADGSVQIAIRDAAGTITTGARSAADTFLAVGTTAQWSSPVFYLGSGYGGLAPGSWMIHRVKVAAGVVDWSTMDGLS